jgi:hypothetical protein
VRLAASEIAAAERMTYVEASAKTGDGIETLRETIATMCLLGSAHYVLLLRKERTALAAQELGLIFEATRSFAGVRVPRDVLGLLQRAVLATAPEDVWDVPRSEKSAVTVAHRRWWRNMFWFFSFL